jgi:predicted RNA-binding Zn-ribbon protein involved in translation (DUF1610 family)
MNEEQNINEPLKPAFLQGAVMPSFDDVVRINQGRFISQTTHFICAKCGGDTPLSNRELLPLKTELVADKLVRIYFPCPKCDETYDIGLSVLS